MEIGPKEFVDALLTAGWDDRFESFSERDLRFLNAYNDLCWKLADRAFFREPASIHFGASGEQVQHAGVEAMENAGVTLRRTLLPKEITNHNRVLGILRSRVHTDSDKTHTIALLDELQRGFDAARTRPLMHEVDPADVRPGVLAQPKNTFDATRVLDDWLHGIVIHGDPDKQADVTRWGKPAYEWSLVKAMTDLAKALLETQVAVRGALGIIDEDRRAPKAA